MIDVFLSGCNGSMGKVLQDVINGEEDMRLAAGFDTKTFDNSDFPVFTDIKKCNINVDVIIDFSHFTAFDSVLKYALDNKIPLVMATTGLEKEAEDALINASKSIPVFRTANMSVGVNILLDIVGKVAKQLSDFDIEIVEKHHNKKVDSPSGTALMLANEISKSLDNSLEFTFGREGKDAKRMNNELGIHAIRGGTIAGEHTVIYAGEDEIIELKHIALSKKIFAKGAVRAAKYIVKQNSGYYDMRKILNE